MWMSKVVVLNLILSDYFILLGHYVYTEATSQTTGDKARLLTPRFDPAGDTTDTCWGFFYHMFGKDMGTLNVLVRDDGDDDDDDDGDDGEIVLMMMV